MDPELQMYRRDELVAKGGSQRGIRSQVAAGDLVRLRPGVFVRWKDWKQAKPEKRIVARARALASVSANRPVFSHETAAAIHGLALFRPGTDRVHTIVPVERPGAALGVIRHRGELGHDIVEIDGMLCTNLARTVADTARTMTFEQAVTIADGALRLECVPGSGEYDLERAAAFGRTAREVAKRSAHGIARAGRVLDFADGRAQLPGETISRIRLRELGFRRVALQVLVPGPNGSAYYVDFEFEETLTLAEFDGTIKYIDGKMLDGRTTADVFDREKQREDWIRGRTQRRFVRWGWPHVTTAAVLGRRLAAFGIAPPR
ncbi:hypothetical protein [Microbacterium deminutum]|uniref:Transcriptional regulator, AbiEi antitoxin, Type IV TA system n=1 Tax=Microbacterium deminutum TaxID=344164 RepID=A0ABP5BJG6_9MICO